MLVFLRWVGIANAAAWLGAAIFYTVGVGPTFASGEMARILPASHSGAAAQLVVARYFKMQCWCGAIALAHLVIEWWYAGKPARRWVLYLIVGLLAWSLVGQFWLGPELKRLHLDRYGIRSTAAQRFRAERSFKIWHTIFQTCNVLANFGLVVFVIERTSAGPTGRFVGGNKFRG